MTDNAELPGLRVSVIIPALNEQESIGLVLERLPSLVTNVTVADNGSTDHTAARARAAGANVVTESRRGYGRACLAGLRNIPASDVIVFLDADLSDEPEDLVRLVDPIRQGQADLVMGARRGVARLSHARWGTVICVWLINRLWGSVYEDLGPFRAITSESLERLDMQDRTWAWTIEMQVKAAEAGLRVLEIPIAQRERIGHSKISGTVLGTVRAASRMLTTIATLWWTRRHRHGGCSTARA